MIGTAHDLLKARPFGKLRPDPVAQLPALKARLQTLDPHRVRDAAVRSVVLFMIAEREEIEARRFATGSTPKAIGSFGSRIGRTFAAQQSR